MNSELPTAFCWTRFGTEAGQGIVEIARRKEEERRANSGLFLWGIGNALGPSIRSLIAVECNPLVLFSPTRSPARAVDAAPRSVVVWSRAHTLAGEEYVLPASSLITSHSDPQTPKLVHYALVCHSSVPVRFQPSGMPIVLPSLRNLQTGNPVGASQVTAVVTPIETDAHAPAYDVAYQAALVPPYFLRLFDPRPLVPSARDGWQTPVDLEWARRLQTQPF
jgi:hypothetical protein